MDIQGPTALLNPDFIKTNYAEQCCMLTILRKRRNSEYDDVLLNVNEKAICFRCAMAQITLFF